MVRFAGVEIALRVHGHAADRQEQSRVPAAGAEASDLRQRVALQHQDLLVLAVGDEQEPLLRIVRERDVPHRPAALSTPKLPATMPPIVVFETIASLMNLPLLSNTWMRLLLLSQT